MPDPTLHVADLLSGIALVPGAIELLGCSPELHDEVAGQVLRLSLAPFLPPEADKGRFVIAHDDPGVRAADEGAAVDISQEFRADMRHCAVSMKYLFPIDTESIEPDA